MSDEPKLCDPVTRSSVRAMAHAVRKGEISSQELVAAHVARIERVDGDLNAVVAECFETALVEARRADERWARSSDRTLLGALFGVPMTIKDSLDTAGVVSSGGTLGRRRFVPERDATCVARLKQQGAILLGKTNTPELTLSFETENAVYGKTCNPYDLDRSPGGSSGGAAAIVAAGGSPFDIGSDYGGSIRWPSHCCGTAGIKPTSGRVPRTGHVYPFGGVNDWMQQIGPIARTVPDLELLLTIIAGPDHVDPSIVPLPAVDSGSVDPGTLRVGFHVDNGVATPIAEIREAVRRSAALLAAQGLAVEESLPDGVAECFYSGVQMYGFDGGAAARRLLAEYGTTQSPIFERSGGVDVGGLDALLARVTEARSRAIGFFDDFDVMLCPVNAAVAGPHGTNEVGEKIVNFSYTIAFNITGWPAVVVRAGTSDDGLPIGVQVVAAPGHEATCFAVAGLLERGLGSFPPPER